MNKLVLVIIFIITFWFSSKPGNESISQSDKILVAAKILTVEDLAMRTTKYRVCDKIIRKAAHFSLYFMAGMGAFILTGSVGKSVLIVFLMGGIDEFHQYFVPGRGAQFTDVLIDTLGGTTGAVVTKLTISNYKVLTAKSKKDGSLENYNASR
ncbi:teicoplanin resistance protein VanZ [Propionigenium maris DSM 9537]|uniref:Teicoplanin resistance protein VanZ n=1 Tax=Propionigenium maris DSM 9537 TaxID=1123000 RepID=A0A9W6LN32_9FUSO|nr:VanZ family protein [Propionigenium maris]GLI56926.1 teicoplanin resistance protein VanZ [Propionigenium maris DSM 9537]